MLARALLVLLGIGLAVSAASSDYNSNNYMDERTRADINQTKIFCYLNGTRITNDQPQFRIEHLNIDMCTHVVYGALRINDIGEIEPISHELLQDQSSKITFRKLNDLKRNKNVKTIISIFGSYSDFSTMATSYRSKFVDSVSKFLKNNDFDGVNIDWQYPARLGLNMNDRQNFISLITELKQNIRPTGKLLTASLPASPPRALDDGFEYHNENMMENVDYWFIMALEYYNHAFSSIGANAPINSNDKERDVTSTINYITSKRLFDRDRLKLILVIPFYGKRYALKYNLQSGESPIGKDFENRNARNADAVLSYPEICQRISSGNENWMRSTDKKTKTPYAVKDKIAYLYEDPTSIAEKTKLALNNNLGGVMAYSLDLDDYEGTCAMDHSVRTNDNYNRYNQRERSSSYKYPLLQAMYETVQRGGSATTGPLSLLVAFLATTLLAIHG